MKTKEAFAILTFIVVIASSLMLAACTDCSGAPECKDLKETECKGTKGCVKNTAYENQALCKSALQPMCKVNSAGSCVSDSISVPSGCCKTVSCVWG